MSLPGGSETAGLAADADSKAGAAKQPPEEDHEMAAALGSHGETPPQMEDNAEEENIERRPNQDDPWPPKDPSVCFALKEIAIVLGFVGVVLGIPLGALFIFLHHGWGPWFPLFVALYVAPVILEIFGLLPDCCTSRIGKVFGCCSEGSDLDDY